MATSSRAGYRAGVRFGRSCKGRAGQVIALSPILFLAVAGLLALAVDVGSIAVEKSCMQNAADAAALAATRVLSNGEIAGKTQALCRADAVAAAQALLGGNAPGTRLALQFGECPPGGAFTPLADTCKASAVQARVLRDSAAPAGPLPMTFASVLGLPSLPLSSTATALVSYKITGIFEGLRPFAVPKDRIPPIGGTMVFYPGNSTSYNQGLGNDMVVPGCWGLLNLDGGDLSSSEIIDWIYNGYNGGIELNPSSNYVWIDGTSGFRATMNQPLQSIRGSTFIMCIYDQVVGSGSNGSFRIVGFLLATIIDSKLVGNNPYVKCQVSAIKTLHGVKVGPGNDDLNINKVLLVQ
jgi:Flp pilus assembly protein TadG